MVIHTDEVGFEQALEKMRNIMAYVLTATNRSHGYGGATLGTKKGPKDVGAFLTAYLRPLEHANFTREHDTVWLGKTEESCSDDRRDLQMTVD